MNEQGRWDFMARDEAILWAWVAGIIDGEGCIRIKKPVGKHPGGLLLSVRMTHLATITRLREITGVGPVIMLKRRTSNLKMVYDWTAKSQEAAAVLRCCFPVLVTKKAQAKLALQYAEIVGLQPRAGYNHSVPISFLERRQKIREAISRLNKNGA